LRESLAFGLAVARLDLIAFAWAAWAARISSRSIPDTVVVFENVLVGHVFEQASHNGELVHAVEAGRLERSGVTELGAVLAGDAPGRESDDEITTFDSTGLAIQDLAIALAAIEREDELDLPTLEL
jgi:ornithine cyclodeaminase/alanine dehydrogenase-like protein (mu-crystallin family)